MIQETLDMPEFGEFAPDLMSELKAFIMAWRTARKARKQKIRKVVVLAAGWQPRLLSLSSLSAHCFQQSMRQPAPPLLKYFW
jgi:hypothetical protein